MTPKSPDFNRIARLYRWMEYLSLGPLLQWTRTYHLEAGRLDGCNRALIFGDGDGRFTQRLMDCNRDIRCTAVDLSSAMLQVLVRRCRDHRERLAVSHCDARQFRPSISPDLIVTHFFLDCLTQAEVVTLVQTLRPSLQPGTLWLVSEFRYPAGLLRWPAQAAIRLLYFAFRVLTGLRINRLPDHRTVLRDCGFTPLAERRYLAGVLTTELWCYEGCSAGVQSTATADSLRNDNKGVSFVCAAIEALYGRLRSRKRSDGG